MPNTVFVVMFTIIHMIIFLRLFPDPVGLSYHVHCTHVHVYTCMYMYKFANVQYIMYTAFRAVCMHTFQKAQSHISMVYGAHIVIAEHARVVTHLPLSIQQQQQHSMDTELDNYKKTIAQEQLHNEQLTLMLNKVQADVNHVQHLIDQCSTKREALKAEYMTYTRTLQETEQALAKVETVSKRERERGEK